MFEFFVALLFGLMLGNFGTSLLFRIPRQIPVDAFLLDSSEGNPFCSICHHKLKFYEYLPVIGWFYTMGRCSYCREKINKVYWILESGSAVWSLFCYVKYGFIDEYFIITTIGAILLTQGLIYSTSGVISTHLNIITFMLGVLYAMVEQQSAIDIFIKISIALMIYISIMRILNSFKLLGALQEWFFHARLNFRVDMPIVIFSLVVWLAYFDLSIIACFFFFAVFFICSRAVRRVKL
ncbi:prepilin peptidase [Candidatus Lariskella endosymbiont of Epinotia ramella]|uniref:prepilin peptidase n=1 Tax=Candidatus Lariskella endosymbiont of Epinotia ramella TaxID=3066224 RepID=UPI0030CF92E3